MAAPTTVLTMVKRLTYRGNANEEWSNTYMFSGSTPADATAWRALFDALAAQEATIIQAPGAIIGGYGYDKVPGPGDHAIWSVDLTVTPNTPTVGTYTGPGVRMAGDQASWVRWGLNRYNTKGKRVYLRKYFHCGQVDSAIADNLQAAYVTALTNFAGKMRDGTFIGGRVITDRLGTAVVGSAVSSYVTTRTLKRRGKRPPSP